MLLGAAALRLMDVRRQQRVVAGYCHAATIAAREVPLPARW